MDTWDTLNGIYEPLWKRTVALNRRLSREKYPHHWGYFAFHSSQREGEHQWEYQTEYFPIPVITVEGVCDIGVHLHSVFIEAHLTEAQALSFDWSAVPWPFEVYDTDDYFGTLYKPGMDLAELPGRVKEAAAGPTGNIAIEFLLPEDAGPDEVLPVVAACKSWGTHII